MNEHPEQKQHDRYEEWLITEFPDIAISLCNMALVALKFTVDMKIRDEALDDHVREVETYLYCLRNETAPCDLTDDHDGTLMVLAR